MHVWDDGLEIEGGDENVRVWGNYVDDTGTGISSTIDSVGPLYIWRNVWDRNQFIEGAACDSDQRQPMFKDGSSSDFGNGRRYLFHNTMLQRTQSGCQYGLGGGAGVGGTGDTQLVHNTVSMNNIYNVWKPQNAPFYQVGADNTFQNDMMATAGSPEVGAIVAVPKYAAGGGDNNGTGGMYQLAAGTPGYDQGVRINNFNDHFNGAAPDVGAAEAGDPAMKFGIAAATSTTSVGGTGSGGAPTSQPTPPSTPTTPNPTTANPVGRTGDPSMPPRGHSGGTSTPAIGPTAGAAVSTTMDSSSYTIAAGQGVTFTARVAGNVGTPGGTVGFSASGAAISGCAAIAVANGQALCTTSSLGAGTWAISGAYSGDATYAAATAGPITQTVTGAPATSTQAGLTIDSSSYTSSVGQAVTFTVVVTGPVTPTGTVDFQDNGSAIAGCTGVALSGGTARCTTASLAAGTHPIRGWYYGDASNSAGIAGPITQTVR
jgi:hypothetical protein